MKGTGHGQVEIVEAVDVVEVFGGLGWARKNYILIGRSVFRYLSRCVNKHINIISKQKRYHEKKRRISVLRLSPKQMARDKL